MGAWLIGYATSPVYYVYGSDGNVDYRDDGVYVDGKLYASDEEYYEQAEDLATDVVDVDEDVKWLPLGVFACLQKGASETHIYMQLAVTEEGVIGGTYFNETTNTSRPLQGTVDKKTQRAAWTFADGKNTDTVAETSIYNLTKDTTPVLVHFGPDKTEQIELMRVETPKEGAKDAKTPVEARPGLSRHFPYYNHLHQHSGLEKRTPASVYAWRSRRRTKKPLRRGPAEV